MSKEIQEKLIYNVDDKFFSIYKDLVGNVEKTGKKYFRSERVEDAATEMQRIQNEGMRQDIEMKRSTLKILFAFLSFETIAVFCFSFLQATKIFNFALEEWSFKLLVASTISQITVMLVIAVKHLFPNKQ